MHVRTRPGEQEFAGGLHGRLQPARPLAQQPAHTRPGPSASTPNSKALAAKERRPASFVAAASHSKGASASAARGLGSMINRAWEHEWQAQGRALAQAAKAFS